jgi:integrase
LDGYGRKVYPSIKNPVDFAIAYEFTVGLAKSGGLASNDTAADTKSFAALIDRYLGSPEFKGLSRSTRTDYNRHLKEVGKIWGDLRVAKLERRHALLMRDDLAETPRTADVRMAVVSRLISFGLDYGFREDNPVRGIRKIANSQPYEPWPAEAIAKILTKAEPRIVDAVTALLYTGQRIGDVVEMKRQDLAEGKIRVVQKKTQKRLWIPSHPKLTRHFLERKVQGIGPLLVNLSGEGWTVDGLKGALADAREDLGLSEWVPHGLRKNAVNALLEAGCTVNEVSAVTGQTPQMVEHYAQQVNQLKLAEKAMEKWGGE